MRFSIIVPVFNAEKTIHRCLDSLFCQACNSSFEVIAIDDASNDSSYNLLSDYSNKEARLKVFRHETNKRQTVARRTGMDNAIGDYILHVDSDDYLLPGALNAFETILETNDVDVVVFNSFLNYPNGTQEMQTFTKSKGLVTNKEDVQDAFYYHSGTKIVRRDLTKNMITGMEEISTTADDLLYNFEIFCRASSIYMSEYTFYVACINPQSLTRTTLTVDRLNSQILVNKVLIHIIKVNQPSNLIIDKLNKYNISAIDHFFFLAWIHKEIHKVKKEELIQSFLLFEFLNDDDLFHLERMFKSIIYPLKIQIKKVGNFRAVKSLLSARLKLHKIKIIL